MTELRPIISSVRATKLGAAVRQLEAAIDAFERGDYAVAITLAGAAEGMLPTIPSQPLFESLRDHPKAPLKGKPWVSVLNRERDWLKHPSEGAIGPVIEIDHIDTAVMLLRALARVPDPWSERMEALQEWAKVNGFGPQPFKGQSST
jgi:hypothetical protein